MKRGRMRWVVVVCFLAAVGVLIWHYTRPEPVQVRVKAAEQGVVERTVANTRAGTVKAFRRAKLSPSAAGQIAALPVREGDTVKAGQLLLELWNEDLAAEAKLAQRETEEAEARVTVARLQADVAQREADRLVKLRKTGAASEERTDRAVTDAKALWAEYEAAKAAVLMSQARVLLAQANLERTRLTAPFDGIIAKINGELNEYLTPSPPGIPTPPAVDLIDHSGFYASAPIDEVDAAEIAPGMAARITLDAFAKRSFEGKVRRIAPYVMDIEKQARTVDVEVNFANPQDMRELLAGYSADVEIILDVHENALRIPSEAVVDGKHVFVYRAGQGVIERRDFARGIANWDYTEVIEGLKPGELIVLNADQPGVEDGAKASVSSSD